MLTRRARAICTLKSWGMVKKMKLAYLETSVTPIIRNSPMLARLLRRIYFIQVLLGAFLGSLMADHYQQSGAAALPLVLLGVLLLPLLLQFGAISTSMIQSRPAQAGSLWWRAYGSEFLAALRIYWLQMPWASAQTNVLLPEGAPQAAAAPVPVLLVHGFICNRRVWDKVVRALHQAGHPVLAITLEPPFASIEDYTLQIQQAVQQLQQATGAAQVALVGHSMGGLVIRAWLRQHGSTAVAKIITLGTPHQGTRMAVWSPTPNMAQMAWHSPWLQALQTSESPATRKLIHTALTRHDNIVYPQREQVLEGAKVTEFEGMGHLALCLDERVIQWLLQKLH
ncbi:MAG: lipase [Comamonadaceae bacterium CG_4_10_14_3_um_filter_60_42]|nr:MAG: lipase [Comamonadaceae bacterium CG_4_10_14_3_um_filter_60_42]